MAPHVSVVLPVFNAAATVARAVASVRAQTFGDWELIVVDDGSTDGTGEVLRTCAAAEPRVRVIERRHEGLVPALNAGLAAARGEFIARMDADDECLPERLAEQVGFLRAPANAAVGLVSCLVEFGGDGRANEGYARHVAWINSLVTPEQVALNRFIESPLAHPSVLFRCELVERLGAYRDGAFPEDYELLLRWMDAGVRVAKVPRVLLRWADSPGRLSRTDSRYSAEAFFRMKAEWIAREVQRVGGGKDVWVWGAGRPTRKRAAWLEQHGVAIGGYIDVDATKITAALGGTGRPVITPEELPALNDVFVLGYVGTRGARDYDRAVLCAHGYVEGRDFLMCA
ncbi:glycosyltransferase family 2 protein [Opitutus terrae]|uniref:Glycosyl transferase family 2 n=1 Tax=Opitutus terrae (strain DSM 11246 / JCM 15787 / PB90-1) TaxID=452637 RepID=B1ZQ76_OPITP|nr:glycosyltransferase family 2 protein [Opitutus terrae]ACB73556.1 glycosyl transferase family 2 [Opitutus terrae PB90-1]